MTSYKDLIVWQKSIELVKCIYQLTALFPKEEIYGIISQIRRSSISIPSNIAEGYRRRSHKEYLQFYAIAYGSALELETQLIISKKLHFTVEEKFKNAESLLNEAIKMLYVMVYKRKEVTTSSI
ncbi:MAG: four helix bundle protein [Candidatus Levyibacteriota bacterium]|nr:MAG: four helix bundle protein [Candidatus Levybacteria bacterium]